MIAGCVYSQELSEAYDRRHFGGRSGQFIFELQYELIRVPFCHA